MKRENITAEQAGQILDGLAALNQRLSEMDTAAGQRRAEDRAERAEITAQLGRLAARVDRADPAGADTGDWRAYNARRAEWEREHPELAALPPAGPGGLADRPPVSDVLTPGEIARSLGLAADSVAAGFGGGNKQDAARLGTIMVGVMKQAQVSARVTHAPGRAAGDPASAARLAALQRGEFDITPGRQPVDLGALAGTVSYPADDDGW